MYKTQGNNGITLIECIDPKYNKYRVRWGLEPYCDEDGSEGVLFYEKEFNHKPTISEIKTVVLAQINEEIEKRIIEGFYWNDMPVCLSNENQFNYKAAYDFAVQTNGENLPILFKFGSTEQPIYHMFETLEELQDFYVSAMSYINRQLNEGWQQKDTIDWTVYEKEL